MSRKKTWILFAISLMLSVASICISCIRTEPLTWDVMSFFVGVLSVLVTILIGWQIYSLVDIDRKVKGIVQKELDDKAEYVYNAVINNTLIYQFKDTEFYIREGDLNKALHTQVCILQGCVYLKEKDKIDNIIECIGLFVARDNDRLSKHVIKEAEEALKNAMPYSSKAYELLLFINTLI